MPRGLRIGHTMPAYVADLSAYYVRKLSGTYAPTNGNATMASVTPSEWYNNASAPAGATDLEGVIREYSGGFKAFEGTKLRVHGGGHAQSGNNGIYEADVSGSATWGGFRVVDLSAVASVRDMSNSVVTYSDGRPGSVHTYDSCVLATNGNVYRFGGARWSDGNPTDSCWKWNTTTEEWTALPNYPDAGSLTGAWTAYDSASGKILVVGSSVNDCRILDLSDDTWSAAIAITGAGAGFYQCMAYDTSRSRAVLFGQGTAIQYYTVNWAAESLTRSTATITAANTGGTESMSSNGVSAFYDPTRDSFWVFGSAGAAGYFSAIYEVDASTFASTKTTLSGDTITYDTSQQGMYGRFLFRDDWRAAFYVTSVTEPPYLIRLPG